MRTQEVRFVFAERLPDLSRKSYRSGEGKWQWLQAAAFWLLDKLNPDDYVKTEELRFDADDFMSRFLAQEQELANAYHQDEDQCLLIGRKQFAELMHMEVAPQLFRFGARYKYAQYSDWFNMWVVVIPWMDGMLLVPKELFK